MKKSVISSIMVVSFLCCGTVAFAAPSAAAKSPASPKVEVKKDVKSKEDVKKFPLKSHKNSAAKKAVVKKASKNKK